MAVSIGEAIDNPYQQNYLPDGEQGSAVMGRSLLMHDAGTYVGQLQDNVRCGEGTCTWTDGSKYEGDWNQNVRHGNGDFTLPNGMSYVGQWVNDHKHGPGKLTYPDGETVEGNWTNDRINGLCEVTNPNGDSEKVIFKDDMKVKSKSGLSEDECYYICFSVLCMCIFYAGIPLGIIYDSEFFWCILAFFIYLFLSCKTKVNSYMDGLVPV